jgi:hypothetical protein
MLSCQLNYKKPTEIVGRERFWALVRAPRTARLVKECRELLAKGDTTAYNKKKMGLPLMVFTGTFEEWEKEMEDKKTKKRWTEKGMWRAQGHVRLNGLAVADYDHLEGDVRHIYEVAVGRLTQEDYSRILLAYVTPSGQGLKIVFAADPEVGNLIDNQMELSAKMGLKLDDSGKDASRGAFITTEEDILFIDETHLFTYENRDFIEKYEALYREGQSQPTSKDAGHETENPKSVRDCGSGPANALHSTTRSESMKEEGVNDQQDDHDIDTTWNGQPIQPLIDTWAARHFAGEGVKSRHDACVLLARDLYILYDRDKRKTLKAVLAQPWVQAIVSERNEDVERNVNDAATYVAATESENAKKGKPWLPKPSKEMQNVIEQLQTEQLQTENSQLTTLNSPLTLNSKPSTLNSKNDIYEQLPFDQWADDLTELSGHYPCMRELFANVHPHKLPAVWFSAAAMFGTLMTRTWYRFWYEPETVRRLNYSIFIIGDPGAGKNIIEKFYFKICDPMLQADQLGIDAVNRYKEGRTERSTSTKAQKSDALKKPIVGIRVHPARTSTGEFIRHMMAAVEQVQGQSLNLHMFSFDAELDNVTKQNKGGDYKDREILEIKAFHNETDGQFYANSESVTAMFRVYWNFVYTGTPYALSRKVNQRNFGTGLCTRLAVIPLPDAGMAERHQEVQPVDDEVLKSWAYKLDKVEGELPIEALNDETYDWQSGHLEIAQFNQDKADRTLLKRIPYYGIGISLPFILMRHWDEWQESKTLTIDDTDKRLCRLAMEIQYRCQHFFFGEMAQNYFEDQGKEFMQRRRTSRYDECFRKLPDEFKTEQFMECFGCSQQTASRAILRFKNDGLVENVKFGVYKKTTASLP